MSIVPLCRVTLVGHASDKEGVLRDLQELGCLQLVPVAGKDAAEPVPARSSAREALAFLLSCPQRRRQVTVAERFDAEEVEQQALSLCQRLKDLGDERDALVQRLRDLAPWGDFRLPPLEEMAGQRLWFYAVPHHRMPEMRKLALPWQVLRHDRSCCYVAVIAPEEPSDMPVPRVHTGSRPRGELERRLDDVELEIEDVQAQRSSLTRWCMLFAERLDSLEDREACRRAADVTANLEPVFGLEAWAPVARLRELRTYAEKRGLALDARAPAEGESPPTLMENPRAIDPGEALVTFYMTPGYRTWDPSGIVLFSFAVFFGMILSDAGYALLLALGLAVLWRRLGGSAGRLRFRRLLLLVTVASLVYGVLAGSYFGVAPDPASWPGRLAVVDLTDTQAMMALSVVIGVMHLVLANLMNARRLHWRSESLAAVGWAGMILGGFLLAVGQRGERPWLVTTAVGVLGLGALLVLAFTGAGQKPLARAASGLRAFTRITSAFGDVLSYLRLFALGLASASLAAAFNGMAGQVADALPGVGLFFALLVLLVGHGLNLLLSISSAVIHGLRLNVIEFLNWGLTEEGSAFRPFRRKERALWTR
jgi:V/A-type H+-transporting ATPase subunit I